MLQHFLILITLIYPCYQLEFASLRNGHSISELDNLTIRELAELSDTEHIETILDNILIQRVVGTENHTKVQNYIVNELNGYDFDVEIDAFQQNVPKFGRLKFKNIIGTLNPNAERYLVLACHYDSKYFKNIEFLGATDSAVPCAMLLNLAKTLHDRLQTVKENSDLSLMLLFFDGEEAFHRWSDTDSIYGARHLAEKWHKSVETTRYGGNIKKLERIDVLVLLDLIGTPDPTFYSYFSNTESLYRRLSKAEDKLSELKLMKNYSPNTRQKYFKRYSSGAGIEDDHIPFLQRGVPILHLIPSPFPKVWHTARDNRQVIDMHTVENLNKIMRIFVAEYLNIPSSSN